MYRLLTSILLFSERQQDADLRGFFTCTVLLLICQDTRFLPAFELWKRPVPNSYLRRWWADSIIFKLDIWLVRQCTFSICIQQINQFFFFIFSNAYGNTQVHRTHIDQIALYGLQIAVTDPPINETSPSFEKVGEDLIKMKGWKEGGTCNINVSVVKAGGEQIIHGLHAILHVYHVGVRCHCS